MSLQYQSPVCGKTDILMQQIEIDYVKSLFPDNGLMIEWGCGGSTIYFLDHLKPNQHMISIEHYQEWYDKVADKIKHHPNGTRHILYHYKRIPEIPKNYYAQPEEETPVGLEQYICPDLDKIKNADVLFVDGIARGPTAAFLSRRVKDSAHVLIHDYGGREAWYDWAANCFDYKKVLDGASLIHLSNSPIQ